MKICFDMDGTIADLYGVKGWLPMLRAYDPTPYEKAKPMCNFSALARMLNNRQRAGHKLCIISWTPKMSTDEYHEAVAEAKQAWLKKHLPSVTFDEMYFVHYGVPKENFKEDGDILFDDVGEIREAWGDGAYSPDEIFSILRRTGGLF